MAGQDKNDERRLGNSIFNGDIFFDCHNGNSWIWGYCTSHEFRIYFKYFHYFNRLWSVWIFSQRVGSNILKSSRTRKSHSKEYVHYQRVHVEKEHFQCAEIPDQRVFRIHLERSKERVNQC